MALSDPAALTTPRAATQSSRVGRPDEEVEGCGPGGGCGSDQYSVTQGKRQKAKGKGQKSKGKSRKAKAELPLLCLLPFALLPFREPLTSPTLRGNLGGRRWIAKAATP